MDAGERRRRGIRLSGVAVGPGAIALIVTSRTPQFTGDDQRDRLHPALAGRVGRVVRQGEPQHRTGAVDDRAARTNAPDCLLSDNERAAQVGSEHPVENVQVEVGQRRQGHDSGRVDDHVDTAERLLGRVEHGDHRGLVRHISLDRDGLAPVP
jgi:hypothetical protein